MPRRSRTNTAPPDNGALPLNVLTISEGTMQWDQYVDAFQRACYVENAFPTSEEAHVASTEIVFRIKGLQIDSEQDNQRELDTHLARKVKLRKKQVGKLNSFI